MDIAFWDLIGKCIIIYIDDLTFFSKNRARHKRLRKVLKKCEKYGISLNPKKCMFGVTEQKLLGRIISEVGISIDHDEVSALVKLQPLNSKIELKSCFGKINFIHKFIIGFVEIVQPLNTMLKKETKIGWTKEAKEDFKNIKKAIDNAPVLSSLNYNKPFYIYSFSSEHTCAIVLRQKSDVKEEKPIAFMSFPFKDTELRYINIEKHAYSLVKSIQKFRHYILRSKVIAMVPDASVKTLLMQNEIGQRWVKWITMI